MQETQTWRELLGRIISDYHEKQRLAHKLGINVLTLSRWVHGESDPRPQNLRLLLDALPEHRTTLSELLALEFKDFSFLGNPVDDTLDEIPSTFYARILNAHATTLPMLRFWSIGSLILQQVIGQLDPTHVGLAVTIVQCMPPSSDDHKIHSLRKAIGIGTALWNSSIEQKFSFLGAESLAGYAVSTGRLVVRQNLAQDPGLFPAHRIEGEVSTAIAPILRASLVAGCLLVSSTQPDYFPPTRASVIHQYAELLSLAFEPEDFYNLPQIDLRTMPSYRVQQRYFATFQQRISTLMRETARQNQPIAIMQAERLTWQQLEHELLQQPPELDVT